MEEKGYLKRDAKNLGKGGGIGTRNWNLTKRYVIIMAKQKKWRREKQTNKILEKDIIQSMQNDRVTSCGLKIRSGKHVGRKSQRIFKTIRS